MAWTVRIEDEQGRLVKALPNIFQLSNPRVLYSGMFKVLCYLDPYGDMTFNGTMFIDLIADLEHLIVCLPADKAQINDVLALAHQWQNGQVHTYLKFYGD